MTMIHLRREHKSLNIFSSKHFRYDLRSLTGTSKKALESRSIKFLSLKPSESSRSVISPAITISHFYPQQNPSETPRTFGSRSFSLSSQMFPLALFAIDTGAEYSLAYVKFLHPPTRLGMIITLVPSSGFLEPHPIAEKSRAVLTGWRGARMEPGLKQGSAKVGELPFSAAVMNW
jgi:hypothetical protein